jgi:competence protein ComEC
LGTRLAAFLADWPLAVLPLPIPAYWLWAIYYLALLVAFDWLPIAFSRRGRLALLGGIAIVALTAHLWTAQRERRFMVHFLDVGQGDAALVITPNRRAILIDAGRRDFYGGFDAGERVVLPYLRYYGLNALDLVVLSHGHNDHAGGAAAVARRLPIRAVWLPAGPPSGDIERLLPQIAVSDKVIMENGIGAEIDGARLEVVYAPSGEKKGETSAVVKLSCAGHDFLFTGDILAATELEISRRVGKVAVLKVAHHGAETASDPLFIAAASPDLAVISVGRDNRYGHPAPATLERLARQGCAVARTDETGAVMVELRAGKLYWHGYRAESQYF